jgi:hypothetical protein
MILVTDSLYENITFVLYTNYALSFCLWAWFSPEILAHLSPLGIRIRNNGFPIGHFCQKNYGYSNPCRCSLYRKHTGARPFLCRGCGKHFFCRETAKKHIRLYHNQDFSLVQYDLAKDVNNPFVN